MFTVYVAGPIAGPNADFRYRFDVALDRQLALHGLPLTAVHVIHPGAVDTLGADPESRTEVYVAADLDSIRKADLVVAYLCADEAGRGTSFEVGYAVASGRAVLPVVVGVAAMYSWRFALAAIPCHYASLDEAAHVVAYWARQLGEAA